MIDGLSVLALVPTAGQFDCASVQSSKWRAVCDQLPAAERARAASPRPGLDQRDELSVDHLALPHIDPPACGRIEIILIPARIMIA